MNTCMSLTYILQLFTFCHIWFLSVSLFLFLLNHLEINSRLHYTFALSF